MKKPPRIFKEINVGHFVVQSAHVRYPGREGGEDGNGLLQLPQYAPVSVTPETLGLKLYASQDKLKRALLLHLLHLPPKFPLYANFLVIIKWRLNLVALSQRFNLYFAVYKDKVHITIPRDLRQTLPGRADLILNLPRSKEGIAVGGFIDETFPHCVNHLKLGNLGDFEVLLMACDDGDVIAYYTHLLWKETILGSNYTEAPTAETQPFFHENVGKTAWGLAIHEKSRLIAVSSNLREVTVFCFGSCSAADITMVDLLEEEAMSRTEKFPLSTGLSSMAQISYSQNYRIKLRVGLGSHNIPAIDFVSGDCGEAELVLATDINGNLWFLNIWSGERTCETRMHQQRSQLESMGWGVLSLPLSYFKLEHTPQEAIGMSDLRKALVDNTTRALSTQHLDISLSIPDVSEASLYHPMLGLGMGGPGTTVQDDVKDRPAPLELVHMDENVLSGAQSVVPKDRNTFVWDPKAVTFQRLVNTPLADRLAKWVLMHARDLTEKHADEFDFDYIPHAHREAENRKFILPDRSAILRTFNHDVQLLPPCPGSMFPTVCRGVVRQRFGNLGVDIHMDRLNMLAAIPELSLVVVSSQIGRAALFSLTKLRDGYSKYGPVVTCRLDLILPLKKHEDAWDPKPNLHLLGIAVAPLQTTTRDETKQGKCPKRWRLILHYVNHTILSYELWRDNKDTLIVT